MNVLIVEDEIIIAAELSQILQEMGYTISGMAVNYSNAISLLSHEMPDIAIIDINLGGSKTGVDLGDFINEHNKIPFIFLTSNSDKETIDAALKTKPNAYLLKPFDKTAIYTAISLALQNNKNNLSINQKEQFDELFISDALFVKEKDMYVKVMFDDILYFKSDKNYIEVITNTKSYIIRSTMQNLINQLPASLFIKIHKSYSVNLRKITAINHEELLVGTVSIPISLPFRENLLNNVKIFT